MLKRARFRWLIAILLVWIAILFLVPVAIRVGYSGRVELFARFMTGRTQHPVGHYLDSWNPIAIRISIWLTVAAVILTVWTFYGHKLRSAVRAALAGLTSLRDRDVLVVAASFGLLGGGAEGGRWVVTYFVLHDVTNRNVGWETLWTVPVSAMVTFLFLGLLLVGSSRVFRTAGPYIKGAAVPFFSLLTVYGFGRVVAPRLLPVSVLVLAAGVSTFVLRWGRERPKRLAVTARRVVLVGLPILCIMVLAQAAARKHALGRSFHPERSASDQAPNVILLIWDTVRAASLSLYGYHRNTSPTLESLATNAVVFDQAITPASWTLPAHASLFTGLYHHQHSADYGSALNRSPQTIAEVLQNRGYQTAGFIANTFWLGRGFGLNRGFAWYEDLPPFQLYRMLTSSYIGRKVIKRVPLPKRWRTDERISAALINTRLFHWLDARNTSRPFFVLLNEFDAHEPYQPPSAEFPFSRRIPLRHWDWLSEQRFSARELTQLREAYDACIYYLDQQLRQLLVGLEQRGLLDNTLIVVTSDHGETLGEHDPRLLGHSTNAYFDVLRVPLVFFWPARISRGGRISAPVSLVDVPATIAAVADHPRGATSPLPGQSFLPLLTGAHAVAVRPALSQVNPAEYQVDSKVWPVAKGPLHSVVSRHFHYIVNARNEEVAFDVSVDPWEKANIADTEEGRSLIAESRRLIAGARSNVARR